MLEEALEVATDPDYRFDLAIQLGKLEIARVTICLFYMLAKLLKDFLRSKLKEKIMVGFRKLLWEPKANPNGSSLEHWLCPEGRYSEQTPSTKPTDWHIYNLIILY